MCKKIIVPMIVWAFGWNFAVAQIGINENGNAPDASAILDVYSTEKGFLTPRMTQGQRESIQGPANALLVYQTDNEEGFYYNEGTPQAPEWTRIGNNPNNPILKETRIPISEVAVFGNYGSAPTLYAISEPGSYYLTENIDLTASGLSTTNRRGIIIDASNVTLDLNGYSIIGDNDPFTSLTFPINSNGSSDGIGIIGTETNITIKNGRIVDWTGEGIVGSSVINCLIENIQVSNNALGGISIDDHNIIKNCAAFYCGTVGLRGQAGNYFIECTSTSNDGNGIQGSTETQIISCTSNDNQDDGIEIGTGSIVVGSVISRNIRNGIDANPDCYMVQCAAYDNEENGFELSSLNVIRECSSTRNTDHGIQVLATGCSVINNLVYENSLAGIDCGSSRAIIQGNTALNNNDIGIFVDGSMCIVIGNVASDNTDDTSNNGGNVYDPDIHVGSSSSYGPIVDVSGVSDLSTIPDASHPKANFKY